MLLLNTKALDLEDSFLEVGVNQLLGVFEMGRREVDYVASFPFELKRDMKVVCQGFFFQAEDGIRDSVASRGLGSNQYTKCSQYSPKLITIIASVV